MTDMWIKIITWFSGVYRYRCFGYLCYFIASYILIDISTPTLKGLVLWIVSLFATPSYKSWIIGCFWIFWWNCVIENEENLGNGIFQKTFRNPKFWIKGSKRHILGFLDCFLRIGSRNLSFSVKCYWAI